MLPGGAAIPNNPPSTSDRPTSATNHNQSAPSPTPDRDPITSPGISSKQEPSLPDRLMSDAYALYTPPEPMSGEYKLLDTSDELFAYILELYEANMMKVKRNALVLKELARLKRGEKGEEVPLQQEEEASVLQYDDVDLLTFMSTHMQKAMILEPSSSLLNRDDGQEAAVHVPHGYAWLCDGMKRYLKQSVSTGV